MHALNIIHPVLFDSYNSWLNKELLGKYRLGPNDFCGPGDITSGVKDPFIFACLRHDISYALYKDGNPETQKIYDNQFLQDMKNIIKQRGLWWLYPRAYAYWLAVRAGGRYLWSQPRDPNPPAVLHQLKDAVEANL